MLNAGASRREIEHIYARNFLVIELLFVASISYLAITTVASIGQHYLEQRLTPKSRSLTK